MATIWLLCSAICFGTFCVSVLVARNQPMHPFLVGWVQGVAVASLLGVVAFLIMAARS